MEDAGRSWNKKASVGTIVILMCMFMPTLALLQMSEGHTCPPGDYPTDKGICCNKCHPGFKLLEECHATGQRSNCTPCPPGQFMDQINFHHNCMPCTRCRKLKREYELSSCKPKQNAVCQCEDGYYRVYIDSKTSECRRCVPCKPDEIEKQSCTPLKNTVCECKDNYYRVNNKCEPCKINCSTECTQHCPSPTTLNTKADGIGQAFLINTIAGVATVTLVVLVLVVLITYLMTKRFTKKKLLKPSSQPSDVSPESSKVLIIHDEHLHDDLVEAVPLNPVNELVQSNLPDCIPREIKIADLIYAVLDSVPVQRVKQLVRMLGVKENEIEQAELDHRSCREAHYQMLRVWAERGSRTSGGGRGGMLHRPLLQELLETLEMMLLGAAAEELDSQFGIQ